MITQQEITILRSYLQEAENRFLKLEDEFKIIVAQNAALSQQLTQKDEQMKQLTQELEKIQTSKG